MGLKITPNCVYFLFLVLGFIILDLEKSSCTNNSLFLTTYLIPIFEYKLHHLTSYFLLPEFLWLLV